MSVNADYDVLVSSRVSLEQNLPGHILTLRDRAIIKPNEKYFWPGQGNFEYHRKQKFLG